VSRGGELRNIYPRCIRGNVLGMAPRFSSALDSPSSYNRPKSRTTQGGLLLRRMRGWGQRGVHLCLVALGSCATLCNAFLAVAPSVGLNSGNSHRPPTYERACKVGQPGPGLRRGAGSSTLARGFSCVLDRRSARRGVCGCAEMKNGGASPHPKDPKRMRVQPDDAEHLFGSEENEGVNVGRRRSLVLLGAAGLMLVPGKDVSAQGTGDTPTLWRKVITPGGENRYANLYQAEETYSRQFLEYLGKFLLNYDAPSVNYWRQSGEVSSALGPQDIADRRMSNFVSFTTSVEYGLKSYDGADGPTRLCKTLAAKYSPKPSAPWSRRRLAASWETLSAVLGRFGDLDGGAAAKQLALLFTLIENNQPVGEVCVRRRCCVRGWRGARLSGGARVRRLPSCCRDATTSRSPTSRSPRAGRATRGGSPRSRPAPPRATACSARGGAQAARRPAALSGCRGARRGRR